jgi:hypothetical protein
MKDPFEIVLGEKAEKGKTLFNKVSFGMSEFIVLDESIYAARALALKCGFAMFCSKYLKSVTNFKNENSFIDIYDGLNFHEFQEAYFYLFGKCNLIWQELEIVNENERKEARFEVMIEKLLEYYSDFWKHYLMQKFALIDPLMASDIVLDELVDYVSEANNNEIEKSYDFFSSERGLDKKNLSIEI